jgi:hypothetical protein
MTNANATERERAYLEAIRARVCHVCLDQANDGSCGLTKRTCAIEAHLPRLVSALARIDSRSIDAYDAAVRAEICPACVQQDAAGECAVRAASDCALLTYLPLVLDAIEAVDLAG